MKLTGCQRSSREVCCTGWKESIGHGSKLKGFLAHIYADLTDLTSQDQF